MKIVVTGATGFVGRHLIPALIQAGHVVRCAVSQKVDGLAAEQVLIRRIEDQTDWSQVLEGIDVVIHLAARVHVMNDKSASPLDEFCKINSTATQNLAEQAAKMGVKRFIFLSSIKVNGECTHKGVPFTEMCPPTPEDPYGQSKLLAEQLLVTISHNTGMEVVILRPPLIYGPNVKANFLKMMGLVNKGLPLPFASIDNKRTFVYVENLVSAIACVIENPNAANQVFLVSDDSALSLAQLLRLIAKGMNTRARLFPVSVQLLVFTFKLLGLKDLNLRLLGSLEVNNSKIKSTMDWTPPYSSEEGIKKTVQWYKSEYNA
jgi:nucleoside-diphosphate-sugar epimerase